MSDETRDQVYRRIFWSIFQRLPSGHRHSFLMGLEMAQVMLGDDCKNCRDYLLDQVDTFIELDSDLTQLERERLKQ